MLLTSKWARFCCWSAVHRGRMTTACLENNSQSATGAFSLLIDNTCWKWYTNLVKKKLLTETSRLISRKREALPVAPPPLPREISIFSPPWPIYFTRLIEMTEIFYGVIWAMWKWWRDITEKLTSRSQVPLHRTSAATLLQTQDTSLLRSYSSSSTSVFLSRTYLMFWTHKAVCQKRTLYRKNPADTTAR